MSDIPTKRRRLSKAEQLAIHQRDAWLCHWCKRPVIFSQALKLLSLEVKATGNGKQLAYYHAHGTREGSPLLDELAVAIDHIAPFSTGGACSHENLCTACWKCNGRKSSAATDKWEQRDKRRPIKGKYGEPKNCYGLTSVFVMLAERHLEKLTSDERAWLKVLKAK